MGGCIWFRVVVDVVGGQWLLEETDDDKKKQAWEILASLAPGQVIRQGRFHSIGLVTMVDLSDQSTVGPAESAEVRMSEHVRALSLARRRETSTFPVFNLELGNARGDYFLQWCQKAKWLEHRGRYNCDCCKYVCMIVQDHVPGTDRSFTDYVEDECLAECLGNSGSGIDSGQHQARGCRNLRKIMQRGQAVAYDVR